MINNLRQSITKNPSNQRPSQSNFHLKPQLIATEEIKTTVDTTHTHSGVEHALHQVCSIPLLVGGFCRPPPPHGLTERKWLLNYNVLRPRNGLIYGSYILLDYKLKVNYYRCQQRIAAGAGRFHAIIENK